VPLFLLAAQQRIIFLVGLDHDLQAAEVGQLEHGRRGDGIEHVVMLVFFSTMVSQTFGSGLVRVSGSNHLMTGARTSTRPHFISSSRSRILSSLAMLAASALSSSISLGSSFQNRSERSAVSMAVCTSA